MTWSHVQFGQANNFSTVTSQPITISAVGSGNIVTGTVEVFSGSTLSSVTDDKSNSYTVVPNDLGNGYYAFYSTGLITNGPTTITANFTSSPGVFLTVDEWAPPASTTAIALDGHVYDASFVASPTDITGTAITTASSGDLVLSYSESNASIAGAGWTATSGGTSFIVSEFQVQSAAGSIAAAWNEVNAYKLATFALAATGGTTVTGDGNAAGVGAASAAGASTVAAAGSASGTGSASAQG